MFVKTISSDENGVNKSYFKRGSSIQPVEKVKQK